ncbi:MAG: methyltransferase MtaB domain-containing protein [Armatimonadota bacterium]|nr:methyltransferase MtaB domain-containing protein [Armatimonadota bacterium]
MRRRTVFTDVTVGRAQDLVFGHAPHPIRCGLGLHIGAGHVHPEINFTLPPMSIEDHTWPDVVAQYDEMMVAVLRRCRTLQVPGLVVEFEHLPPMTDRPEWGAEITSRIQGHLHQAHDAWGLRSALRVTVVDLRDRTRPPVLRDGPAWESMARSLAQCADAGANILSIESVGGKEVHDEALLHGDVGGLVFALGVLAARDMGWLWDRITDVCSRHGDALPGGDSACGFANTAMQLAHQGMLPEVLAAVVRAMGAARSLVAFEHGAVGPSKDCAYEGPVLKVITGCPISMEGKSACCAHSSPLGNVAAAACDLWSNESVQNVRLLSGNAPEAFMELLAYDCRLMNTALERGGAPLLRDWLVESDQWLSPQAALLTPDAAWTLARAIVREQDHYGRVAAAARTAVSLIRDASASGRLRLSVREAQWLAKIECALAALPPTADALTVEMRDTYGHLFHESSYGLV